jgi:hypothetical protein
VKIGDLVKMKIDHYIEGELGIIVDGPTVIGSYVPSAAISYKVAWFDAKTTFWHNDHNLEIINENR